MSRESSPARPRRHPITPKLQRSTQALVLALATLLASAPVAAGATIPRLDRQITDQVGAIESVADVQAVLDDVLADDGVQLFVLFVATTEDLSAVEYAEETARVNSLGGDDALVLVALEDRSDAIWVSDAVAESISDSEIDDVVVQTLEPGLRTGDFDAAVIETARALGEAAAGDPVIPGPATPAPTIPGAGPGTASDGTGFDLGAFAGILLVGIGLVVLSMWLITRLASRRDAEERDRRTGRLARDANAALITTDERIRAADQEAGFVEAEFGPDAATPFRAAVADARGELQGAFEIRQRLDDAEPEAPETREAMLKEIIERAGRAESSLDRQASRIDELRNLERQAPAILAALPAQAAAQEARLADAEATLSRLTAGYAQPSWAAVAGNVVEARKGLAGARAAMDRGTAALARTTGGGASREIITAQQGIVGATALLDAVTATATAVRDAEAAIPGELRAAEGDLAAGRDALSSESEPGASGRAAELAEAEQALREAQAAAALVPPDPIGAARKATNAHRLATELLAAVRSDAEQQARFRAALDASIDAARVEIDRASSFIATRGAGMRRTARTRLAEAERLLALAEDVRDSDPNRAMEAAKRADKLAGEAYTSAAMDFSRWDRTGRAADPSGGDIAGAILGGIIGGILTGGGRGAGWGGSPWGASRGPSGGVFGRGGMGGGGGWGGGHARGGSFGGFGGGGGGHARGGRW
jgi:uncharacterized membrane protein YgcG